LFQGGGGFVPFNVPPTLMDVFSEERPLVLSAVRFSIVTPCLFISSFGMFLPLFLIEETELVRSIFVAFFFCLFFRIFKYKFFSGLVPSSPKVRSTILFICLGVFWIPSLWSLEGLHFRSWHRFVEFLPFPFSLPEHPSGVL